MGTYLKKITQNIAILLLVFMSLKNLLAALPLKFAHQFTQFYNTMIDPHVVAAHHMLSFLLGLLMLLMAYRLYKRIRTAWLVEIIVVTASLILQLGRHYSFTLPVVMIELFVLIVLSLSYKDFNRTADRMTVKKAFGFIAVSFALVLANAVFGTLLFREHLRNVHDFYDAVINSVKLLIFMDPNVFIAANKIGRVYVNSLILLNWFCIACSLVLLLEPLVYSPVSQKHEQKLLRNLVLRYGQNPMSYLAMEKDKRYFFGSKVRGVCAYQLVRKVFVACGDLICREKDAFSFLNEILSFCNQNGYHIIFLNITDHYRELYQAAGFGVVKYGEDACFRLAEYNLAGGKIAKVRAAVNHATKAGITVEEYCPVQKRDAEIERQIREISEEWLALKEIGEMKFMLGGIGLDNPMDRRYFYAKDAGGKLLGFVVFLPYRAGKAYLADVTRRRKDAPQGVLEKIIYEAFMKMKEEGVLWGNLGLSPLYRVAEGDRAALTEKLFEYIYENMNSIYHFKALHHAKEKYAPTDWKPRYLAYRPKIFLPNFAYAVVRVQMPCGVTKMLFSGLNQRTAEKKK